MAVKFVERDNLTMGKGVQVVYARKFVRLAGLEQKLNDQFQTFGYSLALNKGDSQN